jgi:hypothetical protein
VDSLVPLSLLVLLLVRKSWTAHLLINRINAHLCFLSIPLHAGYGIAVMVSIIISFLIGIATIFMIKGKSVNFFVAGKDSHPNVANASVWLKLTSIRIRTKSSLVDCRHDAIGSVC